MAYGANLTVLFYALIVLRQILAVEVLSPGWLSVRLLSWLCTIAAGAGAALMWLNLRGFGDVLDPRTRSAVLGATLRHGSPAWCSSASVWRISAAAAARQRRDPVG